MAKQVNRNQIVEGVVEHLNFSKNGDPNGAVLDSGQFIHMKRRIARAINLRVGQELKIQGKSRGEGPGGHEVIEAQAVNGMDSNSKRATKKAPPARKKAAVKKAAPPKTAPRKAVKKAHAAR